MNILFYDNGLCTEFAVTMARAGHSVAYTTPWTSAFPKASSAFIGRGLEGLEPVESFTKALPSADVVFCPDTYSLDRVQQARDAGKPVWGAGEAERMEQDRIYMKNLQDEMGLRVGPFVRLSGIENLIEHLQETKDRWIKTSKWRQLETFHHVDWPSTRDQYLGAILDAYGGAGEDIEFISEAPLSGVEVGFDCFCINGQWLEPTGWGYEAKDEAYVGTHGVMPKPLMPFLQKLSAPLRRAKAIVNVSNEVIVNSDGATMIEPTIRCPHPPMAGMLEMYPRLATLLPNLVARTHHGPMALVTAAKYCAVLVIRSSWAGDHWCHIEIEPKWRQMVKLSQACRIGGKFFAVPGNEFVAYAVGLGDTLPDAAEMCKKVAHAVRCRDMDCNESALDKLVEETVPKGEKVGIDF